MGVVEIGNEVKLDLLHAFLRWCINSLINSLGYKTARGKCSEPGNARKGIRRCYESDEKKVMR